MPPNSAQRDDIASRIVAPIPISGGLVSRRGSGRADHLSARKDKDADENDQAAIQKNARSIPCSEAARTAG